MWSDAEDDEFQRKFSEYFEKASAVFSGNGLVDSGECRWERALLMKGDYLLRRGLNQCLLDNREREANWKRLLRGSYQPDALLERKRDYVRELLDEIDLDRGVQESLNSVLMQPMPGESWRAAMIERPEVISYCWGRKVRWHQDGSIYLLRRTQMNGEHAELFTFHLNVGFLTNKHERGELTPFGAPYYWSVNGEADDPCVCVAWRFGDDTISLHIASRRNSYWLLLSNRRAPFSPELQNAFVDKLRFNLLENGKLGRMIERPLIESAINDIVKVARQAATPPSAPNSWPATRLSGLALPESVWRESRLGADERSLPTLKHHHEFGVRYNVS